MRKCSSFASIRPCSPTPDSTLKRHAMRTSGTIAIARSPTAKRTSTETAPGSSRSFSICPRRSSGAGFLSRIDEPEKNWKFSLADATERQYWDDYRRAFEACLAATSKAHAPWYVVPADDKENARLIVSEILVRDLDALQLSYPTTSAERHKELKTIREHLSK